MNYLPLPVAERLVAHRRYELEVHIRRRQVADLARMARAVDRWRVPDRVPRFWRRRYL